ncbi:50S ribosomal protein L24 [Candidatus Kaiserbacteria bacterium CG10_big_fil_rev_8_21_14_0_10_49_17]|uniref:Large ribosomal subunit protein uL24 n=1 Tax=Candidatus Kaiserbacteria bacterium CG10_big_fil_rev_8_21_14_0_10_49_17 TaxID=1974609 RepID=A0A2M6WEI3_9BACT|nr:MAG: 50S ribosomal protein L24 [Candidatus Kaiserbacteria bacterium CG10_big_fil_rev_8_21_14_0_10_49_17]
MKIKKGDTVAIIAGKDRGKSGKVLRAFPAIEQIIVEGVNVKKRHQRPTASRQKGQIVEKALPIHVSNAMVLDPKGGKPTRIGYKEEGGKRVRIAKKSGVTL